MAKISKLGKKQWQKVAKSLYYSAASGFGAGFTLTLAGVLQDGEQDFILAIRTAFVVGGVVGALNSLAVTIQQLYKPTK